MTAITLAAGEDGTLTYEVRHTLAELPPVPSRQLAAAWDLARDAARAGAWDVERAFRFPRPEGGWTGLRLHDPDARCWAGAIDRALGLCTLTGLSVCLRLLALIDLLGAEDWAAPLIRLDDGGARLDPALLRLAAELPLTDEAGFDAAGLRRTLASPLSAEEHTPCPP